MTKIKTIKERYQEKIFLGNVFIERLYIHIEIFARNIS